MINCNYKVKIKDIQNKYRFKIFCAGSQTDLSGYYTKTETDNLLNNKANTSDIPDVSNFITKDVNDLTNYTNTSDLNTLLDEKQSIANLVTGVSSSSTDSQYPSAKLFYDNKEQLIAENNYLNSIIEQIVPRVSGSGANVTLDNTIQAKMNIELGASEITQYNKPGKNLARIESEYLVESSGIIPTYNSTTGAINLSGSKSGTGIVSFTSSIPISLKANTEYTFSIQTALSYNLNISLSNGSGIIISAGFTSVKFTPNSDVESYTIALALVPDGTSINETIYFQIEEGASATSFEPFSTLPTPSNPQDIHTISGSNTLKVEGKNKITFDNLTSGTSTGVTSSFNNNEFKLNGTTSSSGNIIIQQPLGITLSAGTYFMSYKVKSGTYSNVGQGKDVAFYLRKRAGGTAISTVTLGQIMTSGGENKRYGASFTIEEEIELDFYSYCNSSGIVLNDLIFQAQLENGNEMTDYQEHQSSQEANIDLGDIEYCKKGDYEDKFVEGNGTNLLPVDENSWEQGSINAQTGENTSSTTRIRTKDYYPIENDTDYYVSLQDTNYCVLNIEFYNAQKTYINSYYTIDTSISGTTSLAINIPSSLIPNVAYMRVVLRPTDNTSTILPSAISNILPMLNKGTTRLPFSPYGTGWYLKKNIGKVDLGTLSYSKVTNANYGDYFKTSDITNAVKQQTYYSTSFNALCNSYRVAGRNVSEFLDNTFVFDGTTTAVTEIQFKNSNYSDATTFKNSLSGVYLYYPILAQYLPITGTLAEQLDNIKSKLLSQKGQTNISQINNDLPFIINASALQNLS